jgi:hypothetical protein
LLPQRIFHRFGDARNQAKSLKTLVPATRFELVTP